MSVYLSALVRRPVKAYLSIETTYTDGRTSATSQPLFQTKSSNHRSRFHRFSMELCYSITKSVGCVIGHRKGSPFTARVYHHFRRSMKPILVTQSLTRELYVVKHHHFLTT